MQPPQYDLECPAAKDKSITHAAVAPSNLDAAITLRYRDIERQNTIELRAVVSEIAHPKPDISAPKKKENTILKHSEALFENNFQSKTISATIEKIC